MPINTRHPEPQAKDLHLFFGGLSADPGNHAPRIF
jgi:hypothetical protein